VETAPPRNLPTCFVRETECVQPKLWIEDVMLINIQLAKASIAIVKMPSMRRPSKEDSKYEDST
jgi:hypothetical protein